MKSAGKTAKIEHLAVWIFLDNIVRADLHPDSMRAMLETF